MKIIKYVLGYIFIDVSMIYAADIYIDPTYNGSNGSSNGSFSRPYTGWRDFSFDAANDYFQKCGTTWTDTSDSSLKISANGTALDRLELGAYYNDGGSPIINSPLFGDRCSNGNYKPRWRKSNNSSMFVIDGDYISINSIDLGYSNQYINANHINRSTIYLKGDYVNIEYSVIGWMDHSAIRVLNSTDYRSDYAVIQYNIIDSGDAEDNFDGFAINGKADYWQIKYNHIGNWDHAGIGLYGNSDPATDDNNGPDHFEVAYNYIYDNIGASDRGMGECFGSNGHHHHYHHNYCQNAGTINTHGQYNTFEYIVVDGMSGDSGVTSGCIKISNNNDWSTSAGEARHHNKLYNITCYNSTGPALQLLDLTCWNCSTDSCEGVLSDYEFVNIVSYNSGQYGSCAGNCDAIQIIDCNNRIDLANITFDNMIFYDWQNGSNQFAEVEGTFYNTASDFQNNWANATNIRDIDPGLANPSNHQLWPANASSPVYGTGMDLGAQYNQLLNPDSDFTANPPVVNTVQQPANWNIGAYALPESPPINLAPIVNAGTDQSITLPATAVLDATVTDDGLPNPPAAVTTTWTKQSGPGTVTFSNASAVDTTADFSTAGTYVLRLSADDSDLQTYDDVTITVNPDTTPPVKPTGLVIIE